VLRAFLIAALAGAIAALAALASVDLVELPHYEPRVTRDATGVSLERWIVNSADRLAATGADVEPRPPDVARLTDPELVGVSVTTMKVRDTDGSVIGVASRIVARGSAGATPATWWSFVMGDRGTLAAYVPDATHPDAGQLLGGTRTFADVTGTFVEQARTDGGFALSLRREPTASRP
jgi:hypothetical protein